MATLDSGAQDATFPSSQLLILLPLCPRVDERAPLLSGSQGDHAQLWKTQVEIRTSEGHRCMLKMQVADVHRP